MNHGGSTPVNRVIWVYLNRNAVRRMNDLYALQVGYLETMDFTALGPAFTSLGTFVGGGLIGATITMISDGRLNRNAIDAQLKAEEREVVAEMLTIFQRATNSLGMMKLEELEDVERFSQMLGRFVHSAEHALDLMPRIELTVRDEATRRALTNFLTKLGLVMHYYVAPVLGSHPPEKHNDLQRRYRLLRSQGKELNEYYENSLRIARRNLKTEAGARPTLRPSRAKGKEVLPELHEIDRKNSDRLKEATFRRFDPDFVDEKNG